MEAVDALQEQIAAYLSDRFSLRALHGWLARCEIGMPEQMDAAWKDLASRVWALIAEWDAGYRDEAEVRAELAAMLYGRREIAIWRQAAPEGQTIGAVAPAQIRTFHPQPQSPARQRFPRDARELIAGTS